jgi:tetratricopeptide (TPR) repeat protein
MKANQRPIMAMDGPQSLVMEGIRELYRGNEEGALEAFSMVLAGTGDALAAALCYARLLLLRRRYAEAVSALETLVRDEPDCLTAWLLLGTAQRASYRMFDAVRSYQAALALEPGNAEAAEALNELLEVQEP